jgi:hypothetical protein
MIFSVVLVKAQVLGICIPQIRLQTNLLRDTIGLPFFYV